MARNLFNINNPYPSPLELSPGNLRADHRRRRRKDDFSSDVAWPVYTVPPILRKFEMPSVIWPDKQMEESHIKRPKWAADFENRENSGTAGYDSDPDIAG